MGDRGKSIRAGVPNKHGNFSNRISIFSGINLLGRLCVMFDNCIHKAICVYDTLRFLILLAIFPPRRLARPPVERQTRPRFSPIERKRFFVVTLVSFPSASLSPSERFEACATWDEHVYMQRHVTGVATAWSRINDAREQCFITIVELKTFANCSHLTRSMEKFPPPCDARDDNMKIHFEINQSVAII